MVAPVGMDFSDSHQRKLEELGIDFSGVAKLPGKTFRWSGRYSGSMDNVETISTEVNVLGDFSPEIPEQWRSPRVLFCANTHPSSQVSVLDQCPESEIMAIDTFMLWIETERFQTSQHVRLRSDQDHQSELTSRIRTLRNTNIGSSTAKDKLDSIVRNLSGERNENRFIVDGPNDSLKFSQLKPTSSRDDPNPLPGLRRLG